MVGSDIKLNKDKPNIIVAFTDKSRYIAFNNDLPWKRSLKGDMRFINILIRLNPNTAVIVGRKTYETLPKMNGVNLYVVGSKEIHAEGIQIFKTVTEAVEKARCNGMYVVIFGGAKIYEEAMEKYDCEMFFTIVEEDNLQGDRIFPEYSANYYSVNYSSNLVNISKQVDEFLIQKNVPKTWLSQDDYFLESGFKYRFFKTI